MFMRSFPSDPIPLPRLVPKLDIALSQPRLDVEIGAGQGLHAIQYAQKNPDRHLIAIERTHTRFTQMARRHQDHADLKNLFPVHADALSIFVHYIPDQSVEQIFLLYPNPYPKFKQANLRWHNMPFMNFLKTKLKKGGRLVLATNIEEYAGEAEQKMVAAWRFELSAIRVLGRHDRPRTHFEKKYLERGQNCWDLVFVNPGPTVKLGDQKSTHQERKN